MPLSSFEPLRRGRVSGLICAACGPTNEPVRPVAILVNGEGGELLLCEACEPEIRIKINGHTWRVGEPWDK